MNIFLLKLLGRLGMQGGLFELGNKGKSDFKNKKLRRGPKMQKKLGKQLRQQHHVIIVMENLYSYLWNIYWIYNMLHFKHLVHRSVVYGKKKYVFFQRHVLYEVYSE